METTVLCRCCLFRHPEMDLRTPYVRLETGVPEVYMDMLEKCFEIQLILNSDEEVGICAVCVRRLRDASDFKLQVQRSQAELRAQLQGALQVKEETPAVESIMEDGAVTSEEPVFTEEPPVKTEMEDEDETSDEERQELSEEDPAVKSIMEDGGVTSEEPVLSEEPPVKTEMEHEDQTSDEEGQERSGITNDKELECFLKEVLDQSDVEGDDLGDNDDLADGDFILESLHRTLSSSSDSLSSDNESVHAVSESQRDRGRSLGRGRGRGRGQSRGRGRPRGRSTGSRARGTVNVERSSTYLDSRALTIENSADTVELPEHVEWKEGHPELTETPIMQPAYLPVDRSLFDKIDYFRQYIDNSVIENMVDKTNWSYFSRNLKSLDFTFEQCNIYIAVSMLMSCINYPSIRMYWSKEFRVPSIANSISRNRFLMLRNSLKVVLDEDVRKEERDKDRLWKVRPLLDAVLKGCKIQECTKEMCVDEMMIPFQGICGLKQFCPGKPNPVGLKAFVLATPGGLVSNFVVYQGNTTFPDYGETQLGVAEKAVLSLTENLVPGHKLYFDRYFTSERLILELKNRGLMGTGTLMRNRIAHSARSVLVDDKAIKKKPRGYWHTIGNDEKKLVLTKWLDSKPISFLSNIDADQTSDNYDRWSKSMKEYVSVPRPQVVKAYNTNMGGVDMADRIMAVCPYRYRTYKWTLRVISHFIDLAVTNSWILYRSDELKKGSRTKAIPQVRSFKMDIAKAIINANAKTAFQKNGTDSNDGCESQEESQEEQQQISLYRKRAAPAPIPEDIKRYRGADHLPEIKETQMRCRQDKCKNKTKVMCSTCNIHLCLTQSRNCFKEFHKKKNQNATTECDD